MEGGGGQCTDCLPGEGLRTAGGEGPWPSVHSGREARPQAHTLHSPPLSSSPRNIAGTAPPRPDANQHVAGPCGSVARVGVTHGLWLPGGCTHDLLYLGRWLRLRLRLGLSLRLRLKHELRLCLDKCGCRSYLHLLLWGWGRGRRWAHDWRGRGHDGLQVSEATQ